MKIMKKVLIGFGIIIILVLAAAVIVPVLFKDDIKAAIDKEVASSVNADVIFDVDDFGLTLFKNFPNAANWGYLTGPLLKGYHFLWWNAWRWR